MPARPDPPARRPRVALYGHDTLGLGHLRRNLALAAAFAGDDVGADVLILTGAAVAGRFDPPPGIDVVVLPGVDKATDGSYAAARLRQPLDDVVRVRAAVAGAALRAFAPDVLVVDKVPLGFRRELGGVLPTLRRRGTRLVLGLRDVLDDPAVARRQWRDEHCTETVRTLYDEVWVYGDRAVHDLTTACAMPPVVARRTHHLGYLVRAAAAPGAGDRGARPVPGPYVLGMLGGGRDGGPLAQAIARARPPAGHTTVLVTGPYLPAADQRCLVEAAAGRTDLRVVEFAAGAASWLRHADAVVAMGGANTVTEILDSTAPALLVPRVRPRREQLVRAEALAGRGLVDLAHPDHVDGGVIGAWLAASVGRRVERAGVRLDGLAGARRRLAALLGGAPVREVLDVAV